MSTARLVRFQPMRFYGVRPQIRTLHASRGLSRQKVDEHSAHTISQRLRTLKKIPPELLPLGVVIGFALSAAIFAMGKKLFTDKTLRLHKSEKKH
ncbi:hypothetical protein GJ744_010352 [Endocarpon pusillum]|uniref:NADH-ubiquinone reductase complex 1 MLRQ subunit n=1 Tax=Endocarpon pusillum TaxID=364733 RepID=A0A8H7AI94_9EURO|nr:hypothetical protein GJ744_010352 [Endocarpon pusillum]